MLFILNEKRNNKSTYYIIRLPIEYKKGESQTNIEITKEEDWNRILQIEEEQVKLMCDQILEFKPDLVITEKGVSDLAQHYLLKGGASALRRVKNQTTIELQELLEPLS